MSRLVLGSCRVTVHSSLHWQVIQTIPYTVEQVDGRDRIIRFDSIEPGMLVTIAYLDTDHNRITTAHDHVRSDEGVVQPTPVQLQRNILEPPIGLWGLPDCLPLRVCEAQARCAIGPQDQPGAPLPVRSV